MRSKGFYILKYSVVLSGAVLLVICFNEADAKTKKRTKRVSSHGHSHGHGHEESPLILGAGLSISKGFGGASSGGGEEGGDHSGHAHLTEGSEGYSLSEGHDHGSEGAEGETSSSPEPVFSGLVGYRIHKNTSLNLNLGFGTTSGISDPVFGADIRMSKIGKISSSVIPSITIPISKASKDSYKMTTFSVSWNPSLRRGKFLHSGTLGMAKSYYSKTVIIEEAAAAKSPTNSSSSFLLQDGDHGHGEESDIVEEGEDLGTGDREFDRYSASTSVNYKLTKSLLLGGGFGLAVVTKQFGPTQMETNATIAKGTYIWNSVSTSLSLGVSASKESFSVPNSPFASLSLFYSYE